ncbi:hypothetical protein F5Y06DRAFT_302204 [Hypoxylon sp. FL0890]|nr:hypothetical protein F5Y06DRAFT_302204 [Hypoxylon sp. FL0890]
MVGNLRLVFTACIDLYNDYQTGSLKKEDAPAFFAILKDYLPCSAGTPAARPAASPTVNPTTSDALQIAVTEFHENKPEPADEHPVWSEKRAALNDRLHLEDEKRGDFHAHACH